MDQCYVTLPSDSSANFIPNNTIASFRTKLATSIELEPDKWEVGLVEISYPRGYKKSLLYNTLRFVSTPVKFPVKHYESLNDLIAHLTRNFKSLNRKEQFITSFSELLNNFLPPHESTTGLLNMCHGQNSLHISENVVSHFPVKVYKSVEDLVETIMTPANCRSSRVTLAAKDNFDFTLPEPVYVYMDIIRPNLVGDSYVRLLTSLHFPSATGFHRFNYPMYSPVEQSFIESIAIRLVTKLVKMWFLKIVIFRAL